MRFVRLLLVVPLALAIILLAISNRHQVNISFDPLLAGASDLSISSPLYIIGFVTFFFGLIVGAVAMWFSQGRWRRSARSARREADRWHLEVDRKQAQLDKNTEHQGLIDHVA